jgi:hypothetical protein
MAKRRDAAPIGELLPKALEGLGVAPRRLTRDVVAAWELACEPAWRGRTRPVRLVGGVLVVGVDSAALRQELSQFHARRLLEVLRAALPRVVLTDVRFTLGGAGPAGEGA